VAALAEQALVGKPTEELSKREHHKNRAQRKPSAIRKELMS
jgi:hypothetical protein